MEKLKGDFQEVFINNTNTVNIKEEIFKYSKYWKWFVLCSLFACCIVYIYLRYATPIYQASASILIKDNQKSGISDELKTVADLGIVGTGSANNTDNEIQIIKSRKIVGRVVDSLQLNIIYYSEGTIKTSEVYDNRPIKIEFLEKNSFFEEIDTSFVISVLNEESIELKSSIEKKVTKLVKFNETFTIANLGKCKVFNLQKKNFKPQDLKVFFKSRNKIIDTYRSKIRITPADKNSSVLDLSLADPIKLKAEEILNELVRQYNLDAISDKSVVSLKTKDFIEERLSSIGSELGAIQDDVKNYKTKYNISGLSEEGAIALEEISSNNSKIAQLKTQIDLVNSIEKEINESSSDGDEVLPANLGFEDGITSSSIIAYNDLIIQKNKLKTIAGDRNPNMIALNRQINTYKRNLNSNLDNIKSSLRIQLEKLSNESNKVKTKVSNFPLIERGMIDIERERLIYSELYSYLLKKKEETAISLAVTVPNAKIIDYAYSNGIPVSPKKKIIYLAALLLGLIIPFIIIYIRDVLDTKIHSRKDIEEFTSIPFMGDVPHSENNKKIVIDKDSRTSTAEAFRLIRTNLGFMLPKKDNGIGKTIFITSTTSGEGKSFVSINLAAALSLSNKKVLLLGLDLRAPKITEYLEIPERKGITNFITNNEIRIDDIKFSIPEIKDLDIISSGVIPPNPAELLMGDKVSELFAEVKSQYDFIIVDTAPINLVTDTLLVAKYADMVLYITRANYLDKRMLAVADNLYREKKLPKMAIILNDTDMERGYGYGYGYGYGVGYLEQTKKPWYKRIFS